MDNCHNGKVSIVIPVYNTEKFLKETLDSVIAQTYTNWEIVAVDDHSSDSSVEILQNYADTDSRIKFHIRDSERKGGSVCRNIGLVKAVGEYVIFLDSDDLLRPFCLEQRVKVMNTQKVCFAIFPMHSFETTKDTSQLCTQLDKKEHLWHFIATHCIWSIHCVIWKKDTLVSLGGFNEKYPRLQDPELHLRALLSKTPYSVNAELPFDCYYRMVPKMANQMFLQKVLISYQMYVKEIVSYHRNNTLIPKSNLKHAYKALSFAVGLYYYGVDAPVPFVGQIFSDIHGKLIYNIIKTTMFFYLHKIDVTKNFIIKILSYLYCKEINKIP
jgi:glycosyltransferase involved in cell wall biosynthesis